MRYSTRHLHRLLQEAEAAVAQRRREAGGGVYQCKTDEEFRQLAATLPMAGPGEVGVLLAPRQLTPEEWASRHSPQPPVHHNEREVQS